MIEQNKIYLGDCLEVMGHIDDNSIDMVFTSPPYAMQRKTTYGGTKEEEYKDWFLPIFQNIKRILKPNGSFFLNIKPNANDGVRTTYVMEIVLTLSKYMYFIDELCWIKNAYPGKYNNRFKNGFEPIYHFSKSKEIKFNPYNVAVEIKEESKKRANRKQNDRPKNGSGMGGLRYTEKYKNSSMALPSNVLNIYNSTNQHTKFKNEHPATFPVKLVDFFVKAYTDDNDIVLDPFVGSGTTAISCMYNNRNFIGIEKEEKYFNLATERIKENTKNSLF